MSHFYHKHFRMWLILLSCYLPLFMYSQPNITGSSQNEALGKTFTSSLNAFSSNTEMKATDGDSTTFFWSSGAPGNGDYFLVDLGNIVFIDRILILQAITRSNDYVRSGVLEYSTDSLNWLPIADMHLRRHEFNISSTAMRYLRILVAASQGWWVQIGEFQAYSAGLPLSLDFGAVNIGESKASGFTILNDGTENLEIANISSNNSAFNALETTFTVSPDSRHAVSIEFSPLLGGLIEGILTIDSNDPDEPSVTINLMGTGNASELFGITSPQSGLITNQSQITIEGFAVTPFVHSVKINGQDVNIQQSIFAMEINLSEGENQIIVEAFDDEDNIIASDTIFVILDTIPPQILFSQPQDGQIFTFTPIDVVGRVIEENSFTLTINGDQVETDNNIFDLELEIKGGENTIEAIAEDEAGNIGRKSISVIGNPPDSPPGRLKLFLKDENILSEFPFPDYPPNVSGFHQVFVFETTTWEYILPGNINGQDFEFSLLVGCFGLGEAQMVADILVNKNGEDILLASTPEFTGFISGPTPFGYIAPARETFTVTGLNMVTAEEDILKLRVRKIGGDRVGLIFIRESSRGQSWITIPGIKLADDNDPNPPENFSAFSDNTMTDAARLTWTDPLSYVNGNPLGDFQIIISRDDTIIDSVGRGIENYIDSGLNNGQHYSYKIWAKDVLDSTSIKVSDNVVAGGIPAPIAELSLDSIYIQINPGDSTDVEFLIQNSGNGTLNWSGQLNLSPVLNSTPDINSSVHNQNGENIGRGLFDAYDVVEVGEGKPTIRLDHNFIPQPYYKSSILYENGPLINSPGTGVGGADESVLQNNSLSLNTLGFSHKAESGYRVADDFIVTGTSWDVEKITFFAYQTGSSTSSSITDVNYRVWDGPPGDPNSNVIFGDESTNRLISSTWTNLYRVDETNSGSSTLRPIMQNVVSAGFTLGAGTYWLDWQADGTISSGPWVPPITINGETSTGNAAHFTTEWEPLVDSGLSTPQGLPFIIEGTPGDNWISLIGPLSGSLNPGQTVSFSLRFFGLSPNTTYGADLQIFTNDPGNSEITVPIILDVSAIVGLEEPGNTPHTFLLKQNYPNPFNPSTAIEYHLPESGNVNIFVYDILGRRIRTLVEGVKPSGIYTAIWDSRDDFGNKVSSGTYFYKLQANDQQAVKKMLLLR